MLRGVAAGGSPNNVAITGGTIDGTVIGGTTPAAATVTTFTAVAANGAAGSGTTPGGNGSAIAETAGNGGAKADTGHAAGGNGAALTGTAGNGGATASNGTDAGGTGGDITLTSGTGGNATAGTGNGGAAGNVNLVLGTGGTSAGGTAGLKGELRVNGSTAGFLPIGYYYSVPSATAFVLYIAPRAMRVKDIRGRVRVQGSGGACTAAFFKAPSGTALGSGTALLQSGSFNFVGTVDTDQVLSLSTTAATLELAAGDAIGFVVTGTSTAATGNLSITLAPT